MKNGAGKSRPSKSRAFMTGSSDKFSKSLVVSATFLFQCANRLFSRPTDHSIQVPDSQSLLDAVHYLDSFHPDGEKRPILFVDSTSVPPDFLTLLKVRLVAPFSFAPISDFF
jgi:hypothetical protein